MGVLWRYGGRTFELDLLDAEGLRRFERCARDYLAAMEDEAGDIAGVCGRMRRFFAELLGEDAAALMERDNLRTASACWADFMGFARGQLEDAREIAAGLGAYSPRRALREAGDGD